MSTKRYRVGFFQVEPRNRAHPYDGHPTFPSEMVLDEVRDLNLAAKQGYSKINLFDEMLCKVYGDTEPRMLAAYRVDRLNPPRGELAGNIEPISLKRGQGIARPTYLMFFPPDIVAVLRPTTDAPGPSQVANYLADWAKTEVYFSSIATTDALSKLQRDPQEILRVHLRIATRNIDRIAAEAADVIAALDATAKVGRSSVISLALGEEQRGKRDPWWSRMRQTLNMLHRTGSLDVFETATVECSDKDFVNLLEDRITTTAEVPLAPGMKQLDEEAAAHALVAAYAEQADTIMSALGRPLRSAAS